jgi:hypothetical protein
MGEMGNACKFFVEKLQEKKLFGRARHRLEDNIRMDLREIGWKVVDWIYLAEDGVQWRAVVNTVIYVLVP